MMYIKALSFNRRVLYNAFSCALHEKAANRYKHMLTQVSGDI